jgi:nucleoid-associated protein YgaU
MAVISPRKFTRFIPVLSLLTLSTTAQTGASCDWNPVNITEINQALSKAECRQSDFVDGVPNLQGRTLDSFDVVFSPSTKAFRGQSRTTVDVRQVIISDAEWTKAQFAGVVASKVPTDSCDDISAGSIGYSVENGALVANFDVHYQKNACTTSTCFKGWGKTWLGIPYPVFSACMAKTNVPGASATLAVRTVMTPTLTMTPTGEANIQIKAVPTAGVKDGPSELLKNIVGALTFGIGSKAIQDQFEHEVGDFKASLTPTLKTVALVKLPDARKQPIEVTFAPEQPYFLNSAGHLQFAVSRVATVQPSVACSLKQKAIEAHKFFQSCVNPQREYAVQDNDSLWKVAQNLYGEGQYYHAIMQRNSLTSSQGDKLKKGQSLAVAPFYELVGKDEVLVSYGDSLWKIAERRLGNPLLYRELMNNNRSEANNPEKLITLVALKTKMGTQH